MCELTSQMGQTQRIIYVTYEFQSNSNIRNSIIKWIKKDLFVNVRHSHPVTSVLVNRFMNYIATMKIRYYAKNWTSQYKVYLISFNAMPTLPATELKLILNMTPLL